MRHVRVFSATIAVAAFTVVAAGCGSDHSTSQQRGASTRTVDVTMVDNAFQPTTVTVSKGETVTFRFRNTGTAVHEAVIGDDATQNKHHQEMTASTGTSMGTSTTGDHGKTEQMPHGGGGSGGDNSVDVDPGKTGELTYTFGHDGTIVIGCHQPGHWEAGMKANVTIT